MRILERASASRIVGPRLTIGIAVGLGLALSGCGGIPDNRSMYSVHQPVVEQVNYTLDLTTGGAGLAYGEENRLAGWLDAMGLKYGDKIYVDDPTGSPSVRGAVDAVASAHGILLSADAPITAGYVPAGTVRVVMTRTKASVPTCPQWKSESDFPTSPP